LRRLTTRRHISVTPHTQSYIMFTPPIFATFSTRTKIWSKPDYIFLGLVVMISACHFLNKVDQRGRPGFDSPRESCFLPFLQSICFFAISCLWNWWKTSGERQILRLDTDMDRIVGVKLLLGDLATSSCLVTRAKEDDWD